jgi:hypothetical protein
VTLFGACGIVAFCDTVGGLWSCVTLLVAWGPFDLVLHCWWLVPLCDTVSGFVALCDTFVACDPVIHCCWLVALCDIVGGVGAF